MAVAQIVTSGVTPELYDKLTAELDARDMSAPDGRLYHIAMPTEDGWTVINVWESEEKMRSFFEVMTPMFAAAGVQAEQKVYEIHNIVEG